MRSGWCFIGPLGFFSNFFYFKNLLKAIKYIARYLWVGKRLLLAFASRRTFRVYSLKIFGPRLEVKPRSFLLERFKNTQQFRALMYKCNS